MDKNNPAPKPKKAPGPKIERYSVLLKNVGGSEELRFRAENKGPGKCISYGFHSVFVAGKRSKGKGRGATQTHPDFTAARAAVDTASKKAQALGWIVKLTGGGGPRKDQFDINTIPAPSK